MTTPRPSKEEIEKLKAELFTGRSLDDAEAIVREVEER